MSANPLNNYIHQLDMMEKDIIKSSPKLTISTSSSKKNSFTALLKNLDTLQEELASPIETASPASLNMSNRNSGTSTFSLISERTVSIHNRRPSSEKKIYLSQSPSNGNRNHQFSPRKNSFSYPTKPSIPTICIQGDKKNEMEVFEWDELDDELQNLIKPNTKPRKKKYASSIHSVSTTNSGSSNTNHNPKALLVLQKKVEMEGFDLEEVDDELKELMMM